MKNSTKTRLASELSGYGLAPKEITGSLEVSEPDLSWMDNDEVIDAMDDLDEVVQYWAKAEAYARGIGPEFEDGEE